MSKNMIDEKEEAVKDALEDYFTEIKNCGENRYALLLEVGLNNKSPLKVSANCDIDEGFAVLLSAIGIFANTMELDPELVCGLVRNTIRDFSLARANLEEEVEESAPQWDA